MLKIGISLVRNIIALARFTISTRITSSSDVRITSNGDTRIVGEVL